MDDYKATVRSAQTALPVAVQMEELFPEADHFITEYGFNDKPKVWNTEVYIGERYFLTMQVHVEIDYEGGKITRIVGEPKFRLKEYKRILGDTADGGSENWFTPAEWEKVYKAKGDFSVIGIKLNSNNVPGFKEFVAGVREPRVHVSLLDK